VPAKADASPEGDNPRPPAGFEPSPKQRQYLDALEDAIERRQPVSDRAMCEALGMSRQTLFEWKQDPGFRAWLRTHLDRTSDDNWPLILRRHEHLALNGSVKSAEFIGKVRLVAAKIAGAPVSGGELDGPGDVTNNYQVNVLVANDPQKGIVNLLVPRPPALEGQTV